MDKTSIQTRCWLPKTLVEDTQPAYVAIHIKVPSSDKVAVIIDANNVEYN